MQKDIISGSSVAFQLFTIKKLRNGVEWILSGDIEIKVMALC